MSAKYVLISRFPLKANVNASSISGLKSTAEKKYFVCEEDNIHELLELRSFNDMKEIPWVEGELEADFHNMASQLAGDIRRELVKYVEAPIETNKPLPDTKYIQLRHVEVPADNYAQYRHWRDETIFNVVRDNKDKISSFEAFHSLISGQPGVMFISSFNGDKDTYKEAFTNARYQTIIQQAGDNYITGGNEGLYTRIYRAVSC
ncbi:hypothetical protein [Erwinia sorbitola]|uniref:Uncharacterized protein n=1 Tax=Erwinia sorbitola TaxID=2681984 RepID=A0A6I6ELR2_9GAMM|nr:hypothetical protein [Erwinia sorbitola]MTD28856.1 hypothetical protein [Erwinia sorbitola]QGU89488.1 hypothetical protein GN242_20790 [Erwinia sorbitola]